MIIKFFLRNLATKDKFKIFGLPFIFIIILYIFDKCSFFLQVKIKADTIISSLSIILVANITALFETNKDILKTLYYERSKTNGDTGYHILTTRYQILIYASFVLIIILSLYNFLEIDNYINLPYLKEQSTLGIILNYFLIYYFIVILMFNIHMIKFYFLTLENDVLKR